MSTDKLERFFSIPVGTPIKRVPLFVCDNMRKRKHRVVRELEAKGYHCERVGRTWEVWCDSIPGVTAIYDRLRDIPVNGFDAVTWEQEVSDEEAT